MLNGKVVLATLVLWVITSSAASAGTYSFSVGDGFFAQALGVNNSGQVVGLSAPWGGNVSPTLWNGTAATKLDSLWVNGQSYATAINDAGVIAGFGYTTGNASTHAATWSGTKVTDLGTLGGANSAARSINNLGQVAGWSNTSSGSNSHATVWYSGAVVDLGTLGGSNSQALGINDSGLVVGFSSTSGDTYTHATLWNGTSANDLGTLGGSWSFANAINNSGQVVGYSGTTGDLTAHATLWDGAKMIDLGSLAGSNYSNALAINSSSQSVGYAYLTSVNDYSNSLSRATFWDGSKIFDLNSLIDPALFNAGWKLDAATGINEKGVIVGIASNNLLSSQSYAFVLTPTAAVPEPETYAMLLAGLGVMGAVARRRKANQA